MNEPLDSSGLISKPDCLRRRLEEDGYLYLPQFIPPALLAPVREAFLGIAQNSGWLKDNTPVEDGIADDLAGRRLNEQEYLRVRYEMFRLELLHRIPHDAFFTAFFTELFGEQPLAHPQINIRLRFPNRDEFTTPPHQDHFAIGGAVETFAVWAPLTDCSIEMGGLQVLSGSHRLGLLPAQHDSASTLFVNVASDLPGTWVCGNYRLGDAIIFHSLAIHQALPNRSTRLRISIDFRYQRLSHPVNPESMTPLNGLSSWDPLYENWQSREFQYYWRSLKPNYSPTVADLLQIASTPDDPRAPAAKDLLRHL